MLNRVAACCNFCRNAGLCDGVLMYGIPPSAADAIAQGPNIRTFRGDFNGNRQSRGF